MTLLRYDRHLKGILVIYYRIRHQIMHSGKKVLIVVISYVLAVVFSTFALVRILIKTMWHGKKHFEVKERTTPPPCLLNPEIGNHAFLKLKNSKIHYVEAGDKTKPLLLLVHGFPEFWYSWRYQLQEFSPDYWVVSLDLRGYGESDKPEGTKNYSVDVLVDDLKEFIIGLGRNSCILVAHDWGGILAWYLTMQYPHLVDKLIILNAPHPSAFKNHLQSSFKQLCMSWYMFFFQFPKLPELLIGCNDLEIFDNIFRSQIYNNVYISDEDIEAYKYTFSQPGALTPPLNYYRNILSQLSDPPKASKIDVPVLIMWGEKDFALDKKLADMSSDFVENCTIKIIPKVGHWVNQDNYQLVNDYMREFLNVPTSLSRGLVRRMKNAKRQLMSSVSGIMKFGGMIKSKGKLAKTGNFIVSSVGNRLLSSSCNLLCGMSGVPVEALHGLVMLN